MTTATAGSLPTASSRAARRGKGGNEGTNSASGCACARACATMSQLASDVMAHVFSVLPVRDVWLAQQVCKSWYHTIEDNAWALWEHACTALGSFPENVESLLVWSADEKLKEARGVRRMLEIYYPTERVRGSIMDATASVYQSHYRK